MPLRSELSDQEAHRHLAGAIRNFIAAPHVKFSPWYGTEFQFDQGKLYYMHPQGGRTEIMEAEEVYGMSDEQLVKRIAGVVRI